MSTRFEKHSLLTIVAVIFFLLALIAIAAEIILRYTIQYDIGYYTAIKKEGVYEYPYGSIRINSLKLPDQEFDVSSKKMRIGYFGDSIFMGVGAGDGYRITDLLEQKYPAYDHWTIAMMGDGLRENDLLDFVDTYKIDNVVYGLNLNDILPATDSGGKVIGKKGRNGTELLLQSAIRSARNYTDWLRGKSYLYTVLRSGFKNILESYGYGYNGMRAAEFYPSINQDLIKEVAGRFNNVGSQLEKRGVGFCMVIFPYEMQISDAAAQTYQALGISWEDGFIQGSTQDMFGLYLGIPHIYDAREAFKDTDRNAPAGTYFVYNKGDKIDYNHPNRQGHRIIAEGFEAAETCPFLK